MARYAAPLYSGQRFCHWLWADICVQPGTSEEKLREYLAQWDPDWLDKYTVSDYKRGADKGYIQLLCEAFAGYYK